MDRAVVGFSWDSTSTEVYLNPLLPDAEKKGLARLLIMEGGLNGHMWFATSGTTGRFKFVALSKEALLSSARAVNRHFQVGRDDVWVNVLPTFHVGGAAIFARAHVSGATVVNLYSEESRWKPDAFVQAIRESRATMTALVPTQVYDLVRSGAIAPDTLRAAIVGGGVLESGLHGKARELGWKLFPSYGMTECASQAATAKSCDKRYKLRLLDHITARTDAEGFIHLKGPSLFTCIAECDADGATFQDPKRDGWYKTEDIGVLEENMLAVQGRSGDFLKVGGESVNLSAVQKQLEQLKQKLGLLKETVLVPRPSERFGHVIAVAIEGKACQKVELLVRTHNEAALPQERIQHIISLDKIPRTALGKPIFRFIV